MQNVPPIDVTRTRAASRVAGCNAFGMVLNHTRGGGGRSEQGDETVTWNPYFASAFNDEEGWTIFMAFYERFLLGKYMSKNAIIRRLKFPTCRTDWAIQATHLLIDLSSVMTYKHGQNPNSLNIELQFTGLPLPRNRIAGFEENMSS